MNPFTVRTKATFAIRTPERHLRLFAPRASSGLAPEHSAALPSYDGRGSQQVSPFSGSRLGPSSFEPIKGCSTGVQINIHGERSDSKGAASGKIEALFFDLGSLFGIEGNYVDERIGTTKDMTRTTRIGRVGGVVVLSGGFYHVVGQHRRGVVPGLVEVEDFVDFRPNLAAVFIPEVKSTGSIERDQINRPGFPSLFKFFRDEILSLYIINSHLHVFGDEPESIVGFSSRVEELFQSVVDVVFGVFQTEIDHPHFSFWTHESGLSFCLREVPNSVPFAQVPSEVQKEPRFTGEFRFAEDEAGVLPC